MWGNKNLYCGDEPSLSRVRIPTDKTAGAGVGVHGRSRW